MWGKEKIEAREVAFDIDGVIADTFRAFIQTARRHHGSRLTYDDITDYDFRNIIDFDEDTADEIVDMILENPLRVGIRPMKGAVEVLSRLASLGPVLFVTARANRDAIIEWIHQEVGLEGGDAMRLEATGNHEDKLPILLENGVKYFVEDRLDTCFLLQERSITPIVFDQPWNQSVHPFHRVRNWGEIDELIDWDRASDFARPR
jgi:5'(3')-deoxyribonucleotidase